MDNNTLNAAILKSFNSLTLIDINADKVTVYDDSLKEASSFGFEDYLNNLKKVIHPDYVKTYYDQISLNNLENGNIKVICYQKLSDMLSYDTYYDFVRIIDEDNKVLILSVKGNKVNEEVKKSESADTNVSELIINIQNIISNIKTDDDSVKTTIKYINTLLDETIKGNSKLQKEYENRVSLNISKTKESLLIIDDDNLTRNIFRKVFEDTYNIIEAKNGEEAVEIIEKNIINPDASDYANIVGMFLDLKMPVMDGFGVLDYLNDKKLIHKIPVIIISADDAKETKEQVYVYDIADMIEKPFNYELIKKRVSNMTRMYVKNNVINDVIHTQDRELRRIIKSYVKGYLCNYEEQNNKKNKLLEILLNKYNELYEKKTDVAKILRASNYYDLGLDFVPKSFITNINTIDKEKKNVVLNYPVNGSNILKYVLESESDSFASIAINICLMHNERYDGKGFPKNIKENEIPIYVYLCNIALEITNSKLSKDDTVKQILSKENAKYSPEAIAVFKEAKNSLFG